MAIERAVPQLDDDLSKGVHLAPSSASEQILCAAWQSGLSKQIINTPRVAPKETGLIRPPASRLGAPSRQLHVHQGVVRDGDWSTNYSAIAMSRDNGQNWTVLPGSVRPSSPDNVPGGRFMPGNENFQMGAFMKGKYNYLYWFGMPLGCGGRGVSVALPRALWRIPPNMCMER